MSNHSLDCVRIVFAVVLLCVTPGLLRADDAPPADAQAQIDLVKKQFTELLLRTPPADNQVKSALALLKDDGSFSDLDYTTPAQHAFPGLHLPRLNTLAVAYRQASSPEKGDPALKDKILKCLDYWLKVNPQTEHNWDMVIGIPMDLGPAMLLMESDLTPDELQQGVAMLKLGNVNGVYTYVGLPATGENLTWIARAQLAAGLLTNDYAYTHRATSILAENIKIGRINSKHTISEGEGIQVDLSFQQHGPDLQSGASYGKTFARDNIEVAWITHGTSFAVPPDKTDILARYTLDGQQWMARGASWDFGVTGRAIGSNVNNIVFNAWAINALGDLVPARAAEAAAFSRRAAGQDAPSANAPSGNRSFWCADYMSNLRPDYFASVKMFSLRTIGTECGNGEGQKNYYLPTGAFCLMKTGQEFHSIWPVWNWRGIPGITCAQSNDPYPQNTFGNGARGTTSFVGSVSDGTYGAAAFDFNRDNLKARKSWFFFDHEIVCLGAGITDTTGKDVHTTIDQSWLNNGVAGISSAQGTIATDTKADLSTCHWLLHGDVGYFFPQTQKVFVLGEKRIGSWHDIEAGNPPSKMQTGWVFEAWIDHGALPQDATYAYVVLPTTTASALATYQAPQILSNTPAQQAVWHSTLGILQAAFYEPGQVTLPTGETLSVAQPCLVMARKNGASWQVSVSDPTQLQKEIQVTFGHAQIPVALPVFPENGKTVTVTQGVSGI